VNTYSYFMIYTVSFVTIIFVIRCA